FNVTALVNTSGSVVERYAYTPFGVVTVMNASWTTIGSSAYAWAYLHQGGRFDSTSGLYHFRNRDFSATLGRWTTMDLIRYSAADNNLYRAVGNQPVALTDPTGLFPPDPAAALYYTSIEHGWSNVFSRPEWSIQWRPAEGESGWIIQHVIIEAEIRGCPSATQDPWSIPLTPLGAVTRLASASLSYKLEFTEAWRVTYDKKTGIQKIYSGDPEKGAKADLLAALDTFAERPKPNTIGRVVITGYARFVPNYSLTYPTWNSPPNPISGSLPMRPGTIPGWKDAGATFHRMVIEWNYCDGWQSVASYISSSYHQQATYSDGAKEEVIYPAKTDKQEPIYPK
ncbi:MAG: RHS repeat-associated core domain-containing protein, partial [Planctomycetia bacterium]|nr:RHS repeat-associated core domain-containing protein [Planctomycetia bacterium]